MRQNIKLYLKIQDMYIKMVALINRNSFQVTFLSVTS